MKTKVYLFIDHKKTFLRVQENQYFLSYDVKLKWWAYILNDVCFKYTSTFYLYNKRMSISVEILKILVVRCIYLGWYKNEYYFHMFQYYKWYSKLQQNTIIIVIFFFAFGNIKGSEKNVFQFWRWIYCMQVRFSNIFIRILEFICVLSRSDFVTKTKSW